MIPSLFFFSLPLSLWLKLAPCFVSLIVSDRDAFPTAPALGQSYHAFRLHRWFPSFLRTGFGLGLFPYYMAPSNFAAEPRNLRTFVPMPRSTHSTTLVAHGHQQQHHHPTPLRLVLIQNVAACDHLLLRLLHQSLLLTLMMRLIQTLCKSGAPSAGPVDPGILSVPRVIVDAPSEDSASHIQFPLLRATELGPRLTTNNWWNTSRARSRPSWKSTGQCLRHTPESCRAR